MEEEKRKETIDAGKSSDGRTRELAEALEKVWGTEITTELLICWSSEVEPEGVDLAEHCKLPCYSIFQCVF